MAVDRPWVWAAVWLVATALCPVQGEELDWSPVEPAVVMIAGDLEGVPTFGAALVTGSNSEGLYLATADHVVRSGRETATNLRVRFRSLPGEEIPAELLADRDRDLDLAVLAVRGEAARRVVQAGIPFDILGDPQRLQRGDGVFAMGAPEGRLWWVPIDPDKAESVAGGRVLFQTRFLRLGHSGGALFDACRRLIGMLVTDHPPSGEALSIDTVLERLREWGYPVALVVARRIGCEKDRHKLIFAVGGALAMLGESSHGAGELVFEVALKQLGFPDRQTKNLVDAYVEPDRGTREGKVKGQDIEWYRQTLLSAARGRLHTLFGPKPALHVDFGYYLCRLLLLLRSWESLEQRGRNVRSEASWPLTVVESKLSEIELPADIAAGLRELRESNLEEPGSRASAIERLSAVVDLFDLEQPF